VGEPSSPYFLRGGWFLIEKALAVADRVYALAQGKIVLQASTDEADLPRRLEQAYFGSEAA
jgi:branched-chain amino acid transport system ATP-binding protein